MQLEEKSCREKETMQGRNDGVNSYLEKCFIVVFGLYLYFYGTVTHTLNTGIKLIKPMFSKMISVIKTQF